MTRNGHRFRLNGRVIFSTYIIATPEEWDARPDADDPQWSVWRGPDVVFANRLSLPGEILRRSPSTADD